MGKVLVTAAIVLGVALVITMLVYVVHRSVTGATTRRRDLRRVQAQLNAARDAVDKMKKAADNWHEIDSVLAGEIRVLHDQWNTEQRKAERNT